MRSVLVACILFSGICIAEESVAELALLAKKGDAKAMVRLGLDRLRKVHDPASLEEAYMLFGAAAVKEEPEAYFRLGQMHEEGLHVDIDFGLALKHFEKSAALGSANGAYRMGRAFFEGTGMKKDPGRAVAYWTAAARKKHPAAQFWLSLCYYEGIGVTPDHSIGRDWLSRSASAGHNEAQYRMALACEKHEAVERIRWLRLATAQGHASACRRLAECMLKGDGVMSDQTLSLALYILAGSYGDKDSSDISRDREWERHAVDRAYADLIARSIRAQIDAGREPVELSEGWRTDAPRVAIGRQPRVEGPKQEESGPVYTGSGLIFSEEGLCFTNYHVIADGSRYFVRPSFSSKRLSADLVAFDKKSDLAVLRISGWNSSEAGTAKPPPLVSTSNVRVGLRVFTMGHPMSGTLSSEAKYTSGDVSALMGPADNPAYMQVSVPVQPGNSGGPLVLEDGRVIGVITARLSDKFSLSRFDALPQNVNFAVKSDLIFELLESKGIKAPSDYKSGPDPVDHVRRFTVQIFATK